MDNEYKVGALCDLIASKKKNPIKENKIKKSKDVKTKPYDKLKKNEKKNYISELPNITSIKKESETAFVSNVEYVSKIFEKHTKKNKKIKDMKTEPYDKLKKIKINNSMSELPDIKSIKKESETVFVGSIENESSIFEKPIKKKKIKKSKANEKMNLSNTPNVKSSLENIEEKSSVMNVENVSNSFETPIMKKKIKKSKENSTKLNDKLKTIENKNSISNIKSSPEYIEKESRTIFIGNIPVNAKMSLIKNAFKSFGEIETTRLRSVAVNNLKMPKRASIMKKDFHPQRETANVYMRFKTVEQARNALVLNATEFLGHTIRVDLALNTNHKQNSKKGIFIGNLSFNIQEDEIWNLFKDCGIITAVRIVRDNATCVSKGFGYVDFESKESVELALQLQGKKVLDREIRIKRIAQKNKKKNQVFNKKPIPFKRTKPVSTNSQNFQGETMKSKFKNKKKKPSKSDLLRRKIAKKLNN